MTMLKKLSKTGSSYSVILDKTLMQLLSITPDSLLEIKTDGKSLILTPVEPQTLDQMIEDEQQHEQSVQDPRFQQALAKSKQKFGNAYRRLAE